MNQHSWSAGSVLSGILLGFAVALVYCWFTWARPMQASLDACEQSLQEWAKINMLERQNVSAVKDLSVDELRRWVATLDEQNQRFMALESRVHQQELDLIGPATSYLIIAACVVFGVVILLVYWLRDGNQAAVTTLENLAALTSGTLHTSSLCAQVNSKALSDPLEEKASGQALLGSESLGPAANQQQPG
jgi:hypothetical protein